MRRTVAIVLAAAVVGGLAGAAVGVAVGGGHATGGTGIPPLAATPTSAVRTLSATGPLSPEAVYRAGSPAVVLITDTQRVTKGGPTVVRGSQTRKLDVTLGNVPV